jgi:alpha-tubulin suppressor-like RCC1 family protein
MRLFVLLAVAGCGFRATASHDGGDLAMPGDLAVESGVAAGDAGNVDLHEPLPPPVQLALGAQHSCARLMDETVACWGDNGSGQLGNGAVGGSSFVPVRVPGLGGVVDLSSGGGGHTCARLRSGEVKCWGDNTYGQIGGGLTVPSPQTITGLSSVTAVVAGARDTCAVVGANGDVRCWGDDTFGQVGNGTQTAVVSSPTAVMTASGTLTGVSQLALGGLMDAFHACALLLDGTAVCWGSDVSGELGDGLFATSSLTAVAVKSLTGASEITCGKFHSCARVGGSVACWGSGIMQAVGDGTNSHYTPFTVFGIDTVRQIAAGTFHTCARLGDGSVDCWGFNDQGQLGDGTKMMRGAPTHVPGVASVQEVRAGALHTCALRSDNASVWCWGWNRNGQLGDGSVMDSPDAHRVPWP